MVPAEDILQLMRNVCARFQARAMELPHVETRLSLLRILPVNRESF
jgi:hypothetical protein